MTGHETENTEPAESSDAETVNLTPAETQVLGALIDWRVGTPTVATMADELNMPDSSAREALRTLHKEGLATRSQLGRHHAYTVTDKGRAVFRQIFIDAEVKEAAAAARRWFGLER